MSSPAVPMRITQEEPEQKTNILIRRIPGSSNGDKFLVYWRCKCCGIVRGALINDKTDFDDLRKSEMFLRSTSVLLLADDFKEILLKICPLCERF